MRHKVMRVRRRMFQPITVESASVWRHTEEKAPLRAGLSFGHSPHMRKWYFRSKAIPAARNRSAAFARMASDRKEKAPAGVGTRGLRGGSHEAHEVSGLIHHQLNHVGRALSPAKIVVRTKLRPPRPCTSLRTHEGPHQASAAPHSFHQPQPFLRRRRPKAQAR